MGEGQATRRRACAYRTIGWPKTRGTAAKAGLDQLKDLVAGRSVIVIGEHDEDKLTGAWPGKEGMVSAYEALKEACFRVQMVFPPKRFKDLRTWVTDSDLTRDSRLVPPK